MVRCLDIYRFAYGDLWYGTKMGRVLTNLGCCWYCWCSATLGCRLLCHLANVCFLRMLYSCRLLRMVEYSESWRKNPSPNAISGYYCWRGIEQIMTTYLGPEMYTPVNNLNYSAAEYGHLQGIPRFGNCEGPWRGIDRWSCYEFGYRSRSSGYMRG